MSKYVKELMMDQLRSDLDGSTSVLILDLKGLDAIAEHQLRRDLRKKTIRVRALKNTLARRVFTEMGIGRAVAVPGGPDGGRLGGDGVAELAKEISTKVKTLKKPEIKGGAVDGIVIGPDQVEDITKLPSREALIGRVVSLALAPAQRVIALANAPAGGMMGQLKTMSEGAGEGEDGRRRGGRPAAGGGPAAGRAAPAFETHRRAADGRSASAERAHSYSYSIRRPVRCATSQRERKGPDARWPLPKPPRSRTTSSPWATRSSS